MDLVDFNLRLLLICLLKFTTKSQRSCFVGNDKFVITTVYINLSLGMWVCVRRRILLLRG